MATSPNDVKVQVTMKIQEEIDMEVTLEEEMEPSERLTGADMRNAMQMMGARHELQRSLAEKLMHGLYESSLPCIACQSLTAIPSIVVTGSSLA
ncbi:hypothetical protein Tco_1332336 [Tanacetum coccineum]